MQLHCFEFYIFVYMLPLLHYNAVTLLWVLDICLHVTIYFIVMQVPR
jgi:hypothetical protein